MSVNRRGKVVVSKKFRCIDLKFSAAFKGIKIASVLRFADCQSAIQQAASLRYVCCGADGAAHRPYQWITLTH